MKTLNDLTAKQFEKIMRSDMTENFMRYGYEITRHCDTSLELVDLFTIKGCDDIYDREEKAEAKCKQLFIEEVENNPKRFKGEVWLIAHIDYEAKRQGKVEFYFEGGLQGVGQHLGYTACKHKERALWFNTLDEVCEFLKHYCYNDESILVKLYKGSFYEKLTGKYLL